MTRISASWSVLALTLLISSAACGATSFDYRFTPDYELFALSGASSAYDGRIETKGKPQFVQDEDGWWSLKFTGDTRVHLPRQIIPVSDGFCLELDVFPKAVDTRQGLLATDPNGFCLGIEGGRAFAELTIQKEKFTGRENATFTIKGAEVIPGEWNHITFIWDQDVVQIDVNGRRGAFADLAGPLVETPRAVVGAFADGSSPFIGQLRRVRLAPLKSVWDHFEFEDLIGKSCWTHDYRGSLLAHPPKSADELKDNFYVTISRKHSAEDLNGERDRMLHRRIAVIAAGPDYGSDGYCCAAVIGGRVPLVPDESATALKTHWLISDLCEDESFSFFEKYETCGSKRRQHSFFHGGTDVWANREEGVWTVTGKAIPKDGFYARNDDLEAGIVLLNGARRAFAINRKESRGFFDPRGSRCDFGGVVTDGAFFIDVHDDWRWVARPVPGQKAFTATLDPRKVFGKDVGLQTLTFAGDDKPVEIRFPEPKPIALQPLIDAATAKGGGTVTVPKGDWESKPLLLKSNVTLHFEDGARLFASTNINDYSKARGTRVFIYADHAENVAIDGNGVIDGRGYVFAESGVTDGASQPQALPVLLRFSRCRNVRLEDFLYRRSGAWGCHLRNNDGVVVRNVKCFNHCNKSNDGLDIESCNVLVEGCQMDTDDDAICIKSESDPDFAVTNIVIRNCRMRTSCSGFKVGTGSWGRVADVLVENCESLPPKACWRFRWFDESLGVTNRLPVACAVCLGTVDGGTLENVTVRNMSFTKMMVPVNIRLGKRHPVRPGRETYLRNIVIDGLKGDCESWVPSTILGVPGLRPQNITFRNFDITCQGGGKITDNPVPEREAGYPSPSILGHHTLPAFGFYARHVENLTFENVKIRTVKPEKRPAFYAEDCPRLKSDGLSH